MATEKEAVAEAAASVYGAFKTDKDLERTGVWMDYGGFRVKIARSGGSNKPYLRLLEAKLRPYQRAIKTETIDPDLAEGIMYEVFAKTVIVGWETKVDDKWVAKLQTLDGKLVNASPEAIVTVLKALPDLFSDLQEQSMKAAIFREEIRDANAGN